MPKSVNRAVRAGVQGPNVIQRFLSELDQQRLDLDTSGVTTLIEFTEFEQERELEAQIEEVRETQRPVFFQPLKFSRTPSSTAQICNDWGTSRH